jgi:hypothetical protein
VLVDVVDDLVRDVVADALAALPEEADLGRGDVVLDELGDDADLLAELLEADERVVFGVLVKFRIARLFAYQCLCRCAPG